MEKNVSEDTSKTTLHGLYYRWEQVTFPLISTHKSCLFDLKIFGHENLYTKDDIFEKILQMSCHKKSSYTLSKLAIELIFSKT